MMTDEEFARTLTKEQREYLQGQYEKQLEEAVEVFELYLKGMKTVETLVKYYKRAHISMWFESLGVCKDSKLSERGRRYWLFAHLEVVELDKR